MRKLTITFLLGLMFAMVFVMGYASALDSFGTFKQGETINFTQVCSDATYINISSIGYPNSTKAVSNIQMTSAGSGEYYYEFSNTQTLGRYDVRGISDGCDKTFATYFEITPSGNSGTDNLVFFLFVILFLFGLNLFGFFGKNEILTLISGMALIFLGVYMIRNGVIIFRDNLTNYISYITIAWGTISSFMASYSLYEDL